MVDTANFQAPKKQRTSLREMVYARNKNIFCRLAIGCKDYLQLYLLHIPAAFQRYAYCSDRERKPTTTTILNGDSSYFSNKWKDGIIVD